MHKDTDRDRRGRQQARERRRSRRLYGPLVALVASSVVLFVGWRLVQRQLAASQSSSGVELPSSPVGSYDWDRDRWLASAPAKAEPLFGGVTVALELVSGGVARLGPRSATGSIERPATGAWSLGPDGFRLEVGERKFVGGQITEAGLEFRAPESGHVVFVRRQPLAPR